MPNADNEKGQPEERKEKAILRDVTDLKRDMLEIYEKVIDRGRKLERLKNKSEIMADHAKSFAESAYELQHRAKNRYLGLTFVLIGFSISGVYTIVSGYTAAPVILGMILGGVLGYGFNWARNKLIDTFGPSEMISRAIRRRADKITEVFEIKAQPKLGAIDSRTFDSVFKEASTYLPSKPFKKPFKKPSAEKADDGAGVGLAPIRKR